MQKNEKEKFVIFCYEKYISKRESGKKKKKNKGGE